MYQSDLMPFSYPNDRHGSLRVTHGSLLIYFIAYHFDIQVYLASNGPDPDPNLFLRINAL